MARIWNKHKQTNTPLKRKVFVGLSGGVDSSVSAALLKQAGCDVTGIFIKVWQPTLEQSPTLYREKGRTLFESCQSADDRLDAMRVCAKLQIPFRELDLTKEYKRAVVDYMIREYKAGKTPNPDVMCNRFIKFGRFYDWAFKNGADFVATGHYSRIRKTTNYKPQITSKSKIQNPRLQTTDYSLLTGSDSQKDQSYFLWQIRKEQLPYILFPIGAMRKTHVRKLAKRFGLITADKKDSQGLCFVGKVDMKEFLGRYIKEKPGDVLDAKGNVVGEHDGGFFLTLGERRGFRIKSTRARMSPHYVIAKDIRKNTITVSPKFGKKELHNGVKSITLKECNWFQKPISGKTYAARARYREMLQPAKCSAKGEHTARVAFATPRIVALGQSLVLYDGDAVVGGGIIA